MIFNMEFKSNFAKMISWAIVLIILLGLMLAFYPFLAESQMNSLFNSVLESFNEPTRNILGFYEGMDIVNIGDYLALVYHYLAILIFVFAMQLGANSLAKEQSSGNIEYIYSNPISKSEIVTGKFTANILIYILFLIIMALASFGLVLGISSLGSDTPQVTSFEIIEGIVKVFVGLLGSGLVFMSIGFFFSAISKSSLHQDAVAALFVFLIVLLTIVGKVIGDVFAMVVSYFPNEAFRPYSFVSANLNLFGLIANAVIFILMIVLTYSIYSNKELKY
ncbi:ABC-type transport system involved in multi-copper enzyme maturation, permease component [Peptoniphilus harei]|uniref:ABC transporter permease subunit n=1 Tax=Peptoniphilus harei TaxID=54005 RepID=A0A2X1Y513_9FIRM|nr:ABC transporter permease subunit [Peptoniphilus harei]MBS6534971.1 ABC transporter permease subunit [Peptoniphilus harei]MDU1642925.1 ABC transporter permease subunit [Peptoniphilus harei]MDU2374360.1 ABC transporter permease subunit [Peptoniphilus harei]MDU5418407.1 ABC transporter permease subunit [Peptoniphilus harei]MDU6098398.1 ABC transporter permease subunit [Peptoniphilus harei]